MIILALASLGGARIDKPLPPEPTAFLPADEVWTLLLDAPPSAGGALDADRVYVPIEDAGVRAYDRATGQVLWTHVAGSRFPPLAAENRLFLALDLEVRRLDPATGDVIWTRRLPTRIASPLSWHRGRVLVSTEDGSFFALGEEEGHVVWQEALGSPTRHRAVAVSASATALSLDDSRVALVDADTGTLLWARAIPGRLTAPAAARDRVLVGSTSNFMYALHADSGSEAWRWRTGGDLVGAAAEGDRVFFVSLDNVLRAVNRGNGNQTWKAAVPTRAALPPVVHGGAVMLSGVGSRLEAFDAATGRSLGSYAAPADLMGAPLIDPAPKPFEIAIVAIMRDGRMTALRPRRLTFPDPPLVPILDLPGRELAPDRPPRPPRLESPNSLPSR